jgi:dTMP kinase
MNASRAQLVREVIRPALAAGETVLCDRFYDSTIAYQGYGRQLDLQLVRAIIDVAVGPTRPDLTILLHVPVEVSEARRKSRGAGLRDRMEELDRAFFERVEQGFKAVVGAESTRVHLLDATRSIPDVQAQIWKLVAPLIGINPS